MKKTVKKLTLAKETVARSKTFASVSRHSFELFGICIPCSKK